jgi:hypothetical protein
MRKIASFEFIRIAFFSINTPLPFRRKVGGVNIKTTASHCSAPLAGSNH